MFDRALLWRATDFWREGLIEHWKTKITEYKTLDKYSREYQRISEANTKERLPADFFIDVSGWLWFVKEDGYLVTLSRRRVDGKWEMHTRGGKQLTPPRGFLTGLEKSMRHPPVMVGELVTSFTGCDANDRADAGLRNVLRNEQFAIIHRVLEGRDDPAVWVGLRVKVFAFPTSRVSVGETYQTSLKVMAETLHDHPHIGMCRAGALPKQGGTQQAIDIFERVVQLGLEGIVIVNPNVKYGTKHTEDRHDDLSGTFFKLKQKIVLPGMPFQKTGVTDDVWKDGEKQVEHRFTATVDGRVVNFTDLQGRETGHARIKYMEHVPGMGNRFPCQSGYRHMHFATPQDVSVKVPVKEEQEYNHKIDTILGWDRNVKRIRSWNRDEDSETLRGLVPLERLYNPRPFAADDIQEHPEPPTVIDDDEPAVVEDKAVVQDESVEDAAPAPSKKRRAVTLAEVGRTSFAKDFDPKTHPPAGGVPSRSDVGALLNKLAKCMMSESDA
jgi:hypothetical protein